MHEKIQSYMDGKYDMERKDIENIYLEQRGDAAEQVEELQITNRAITSTGKFRFSLIGHGNKADTRAAKLLAGRRSVSGSPARRPPSIASKPSFSRKDSASFSPTKAEYSAEVQRTVAAPPPYTSTNSSTAKKAPPPPPALKPKPSYSAVKYATAIFDFEAQAEGDLSFSAGDKIEIIERSDNADDWWTGRLDGRTGIFPGTYTQAD